MRRKADVDPKEGSQARMMERLRATSRVVVKHHVESVSDVGQRTLVGYALNKAQILVVHSTHVE